MRARLRKRTCTGTKEEEKEEKSARACKKKKRQAKERVSCDSGRQKSVICSSHAFQKSMQKERVSA